jgi:hypothetical protein
MAKIYFRSKRGQNALKFHKIEKKIELLFPLLYKGIRTT